MAPKCVQQTTHTRNILQKINIVKTESKDTIFQRLQPNIHKLVKHRNIKTTFSEWGARAR
jgi:hypothetical protein